ncbi:hypothetical protein [Rossellomorea marisflavi]|uniref:hypothetical protein n=1 Tax=Rossellomorea marisflavi TaxID=189381 RepID=UPI001EE30DDD|nr:hypothetical protein [Rossellomorea marisflavi]UKS67697.1 hypothetical protein K6T23_22135 [Rossellomorea marisflavi]
MGKLNVGDGNLKKKIPVAAHLNDSDYLLLLEVYANHNRSMGLEKRIDYSISHIVKVEKDQDEDCLKVYYENGDWWHYARNGEWY